MSWHHLLQNLFLCTKALENMMYKSRNNNLALHQYYYYPNLRILLECLGLVSKYFVLYICVYILYIYIYIYIAFRYSYKYSSPIFFCSILRSSLVFRLPSVLWSKFHFSQLYLLLPPNLTKDFKITLKILIYILSIEI